MASSSESQSRNLRTHSYSSLLPTSNISSNGSSNIPNILLLILTTITTTLLFITSLNIFMSFSLGPQTPIVQLNSLSVSNFSTSRSKLAANWVANLTFYNPNFALDFSLERIESFIYYKQDDALSISSVDGFHLGFRVTKDVQVRFATTGWEGDQPLIEYPVIREIKEDQERGIVRFNMRMNMMAMYKTSLIRWTRRVLLNPSCLDLKVGFLSDQGISRGSLIGGGPKECYVFMMLSD